MGIYHRPGKLKDALTVLAQTAARPVAGCTDVFASTTAQEISGDVLDVTAVAELQGVEKSVSGWRIGAAARWRDVLDAPLPAAFDMLKEAACEVGGVQVQNAGTVVGNICNASPAADGMPPLLALDAEVEIVSLKGERHVPLASFVQGPRQVALQPEEMVSAIIVPERAALGSSRFLKLGARKHLVISIAMVAVRLEVESDVIREAALVVGACGPVATRLPAVEAVLRGTRVADAIDLIPSDVVASVLSPISDVRGDADYRVDVAVTLLRRAVDDVVRQFS